MTISSLAAPDGAAFGTMVIYDSKRSALSQSPGLFDPRFDGLQKLIERTDRLVIAVSGDIRYPVQKSGDRIHPIKGDERFGCIAPSDACCSTCH